MTESVIPDPGEVLREALERPVHERLPFVRRRCAGHPDLVCDVEALLAVADRADGFLEAPVTLPACADASDGRVGLNPGEHLGPYVVGERIGTGGMGDVYLAEQFEPIRRRVAIKVIKPGMDSRAVVTRFGSERRALELMQHANVARVLDAGMTPLGLPYFVMEHVNGPSITSFVADRELGLVDRLTLFVDICAGVQHAHQRGVIHRDLKPGNVLVEELDGFPTPKVIDFGISKALIEDETQATLTRAGQFVGTPEYMSPEQASGVPGAVDTRSDVYALGVMLFELLTDRLPFPSDELRAMNVDEVRRTLIHRDRPRPSAVADSRRLRGELDWIVMKCLALEPERRYASVAALADDVRRWMDGAPIEARRDSMTYMLGKQLHRQRGPVAVASLIVASILAFAIWSSFEANRYADLAARESEARSDAVDAELSATAASIEAAHRRDEAESVTSFLAGVLGFADPDVTQSADTTALEMLEMAAMSVADSFGARPHAEATVRAHLGRAFFAHGHLQNAEVHLRRALELRHAELEPDSRDLYDILWPYLHVLDELDDIHAAAPRTEANEAVFDLIGRRDPDARAEIEEFLGSRLGGTEESEIVDTAALVGSLRRRENDAATTALLADFFYLRSFQLTRRPRIARLLLEPALDMLRVALPETNTRVTRCTGRVVECMIALEEFEEAERIARRSIRSLTPLLPPRHWYLGTAESRLASALLGLGQFDEAERAFTSALDKIIAGRGLDSSLALDTLERQVSLYEAIGHGRDAELDRARDRLARATTGVVSSLNIYQAERLLVPKHPELWNRYLDLVRVEGQPRRSPLFWATEPVLIELVNSFTEHRQQVLADDAPLSAIIADLLTGAATVRVNNHGTDRASRLLLEEAARITRASNCRHPRKRAFTYWWLGMQLTWDEEYVSAEGAVRECLALFENGLPEHYGLDWNARGLLGHILARQGRRDEARVLLLAGLHGLARTAIPLGRNTHSALHWASESFEITGETHLIADDLNRILVACLEAPKGNSAGTLNSVAWHAARSAHLPPSTAELAILVARRALEKVPDQIGFRNTLGVAQYRAGHFDEALHTLLTCDEDRERPVIDDVGYLALTLEQLGRHREARIELERAESLLGAEPTDETSRLIAEARAIIRRN